jgi:hypothetical protein
MWWRPLMRRLRATATARRGPKPRFARDQRFLYDPAMLFLLSLMVRALAKVLAGRQAESGAQEL